MWQVSNANQLPCFVQSLPVIRDILASLVLEFRASRRWRSPRDPLLVFGTLWAPLLNTEILQRCLLGPSQPSLPLAPAWPHVERNELRKWEVSVDLKMKEKQSLSSFLIKPWGDCFKKEECAAQLFQEYTLDTPVLPLKADFDDINFYLHCGINFPWDLHLILTPIRTWVSSEETTAI